MNLATLVEGHPDEGRAVFDGGTWHTWGELRRRAATAAAGLVALGVGPGDRVAIAWPTSLDFVVAYLAVLAAGCVAVPLNPNSPVAEIIRELEVVAPAALLAGGAAAPGALGVSDALSFSPLIVLPGSSRSAATGAVTGGGAAAWEELSADLPGPAGAALPTVARDEDDVAVLLFTSGTSGSPKAAMLTHGNLGANLRQMLALPGEIVRADDVSLAAVPSSTSLG